MEIGHRMVVVRGREDRLFLFSPVAYHPDWLSVFQEIGTPYALVSPNLLHETHVKEWLEAVPDLQWVGPPNLKSIQGKTPHGHNRLGVGPMRHLEGWEAFPLRGIPRIQECLYYHRESQTLLVCDLIMNIGRDMGFYSRVMTRISGLYGDIACSRLFRMFIKDKEKLRQSLEPVYQLPMQRIIPGHGEIMETQPGAALANALRFLDAN